jgi:Tfp pilus assembly protein PilV
MTRRRHRRTGFFTLEVLTSLLLVTTVLAVFAYSLTQFARLSSVLMTRQRAALVAEAVLNEIRAGHEPAPAEFATRFAGLTFEIQRQPGTDAWKGLTRVTVQVRGTASGGAPVRARLDGYVREVSP